MPLTEQQRIARKSGIGGSDVAAILGISPWKTPYDVWLAKTSDDLPEELDSDHIVFGHLLEPVVRSEFERRTGKKVSVPDIIFRHPRHQFLLANVDGEIDGENAGLEIKTASEYSGEHWGEPGTDQIPQYYLTQVLHYIYVRGWDRCYVAVLIGGNKFRIYVVERDDAAIDNLIKLEVDFWQRYVETKTPPPKTLEQLGNQWQKTTGSAVDATFELALKVAELRATKTAITELETKAKSLERDIKEFLADNDELRFEGKKIASWRFNKPSLRFSQDALKIEAPDIYEKFMRETPGPRVFRTF